MGKRCIRTAGEGKVCSGLSAGCLPFAVIVGAISLSACAPGVDERQSDEATGSWSAELATFPVDITGVTQHLPTPPGAARKLPSGDSLRPGRAREVEALTIRNYRGYRLLATTAEATGDIVDWIEPRTVPGSDAEPPPIVLGPNGKTAQMGNVAPLTGGPPGSIPMIRPQFSSYVSGESGADSLDAFIQNVPAGQPSGQTRLYGGYISTIPNRGVVSYLNNLFNNGTVETGTFTLFENVAMCRGANPATDEEFIGAAISRFPALGGDSNVRFQTEFFTAGTGAIGNNVGGWAGFVTGLVPASGRMFAPGQQITQLSTIGGDQYDIRVDTTRTTDGNWWVALAGSWVGYYPASLFNLIVPNACEMDWYGEVFDPTPTDWTNDNMGSGNFASTGWQQSAFIRDPWYVDTAGNYVWANNATASAISGLVDAACYTTGPFLASTSPWDRYFFLGGPGGDAAGCN